MKPMPTSQEKPPLMRRRMRVLLMGVAFLFLVLFARLWYLQIIKGDSLERQANNNRVKWRVMPAPRGPIYDRYGQIMADNRIAFDLLLVAEGGTDLEDILERLGKLMKLDEEVSHRTAINERLKPYDQVKIKTNLTRQELAIFETFKLDFPGLAVSMVPRRNYPFGSLASHLLGYVGEIGPEQLKEARFDGYRRGSLIGKIGLEAKLDRLVRGTDGKTGLEVDSLGREIGIIQELAPSPGNRVFLTLDMELQQTAEAAMAGKSGVLIAMNPQNGEILALVSSPNFDPNSFTYGLGDDQWRLLRSDPSRPLQNRALQGQYPAGSAFKVVTALAGLEEGVIDSETQFYCPGYFQLGQKTFVCWRKEGHGWSNVTRALAVSCDVFFYRLGLKLGIKKIAEYSEKLGLGKETGLGLAEEKTGLVPSESYRQKVLHRPWYPGEAIPIAIGQGFNLLTPIQLLNLYAAIGNGGRLFQPWVIDRVETPEGKLVEKLGPKLMKNLEISEGNLRIVKQGLFGVVNEPGGTGSRARIQGITVAGKTGTAQVISRQGRERNPSAAPEDHAWFVAFAPVQEPEIAVVVLVEHGGFGGSAAAPLARKVLEAYFNLKEERRERMGPLNPVIPSQLGGARPSLTQTKQIRGSP